MRCSSAAKASIAASGRCVASSATISASFLRGRIARRASRPGRGPDLARPRPPDRPADRPQRPPPALLGEPFHPERSPSPPPPSSSSPRRRRRAASSPARASRVEPLRKPGPSPSPRRPGDDHPARQARRRRGERAAPRPGAARSPSAQPSAQPSARSCAPAPAARSQPDHLAVPRPRRVPAAAMLGLKLRDARMTHNPCHARLRPSSAKARASPPEPGTLRGRANQPEIVSSGRHVRRRGRIPRSARTPH